MNRYRVALIFALLLSPALLSASPTDQLSQKLRALDNPDPVIRQQAREDLMALKSSNLPELRQAVVESHPLSPEQINALHEIVMQVMLSDAATLGEPGASRGFLGAGPVECQVYAADGTLRPAILIAQRVPGFDAYRILRTDDVIMAIDGNVMATRDPQSFMATIMTHIPGDHLRLTILRGGKLTDVTVSLFARPADADNMNPLDLAQNYHARVEQYWRTTFEPIVTQGR